MTSLLRRYARLPINMYRIQNGASVNLRDFDTQMAKGRKAFDLKLHDGLVLPMKSETFVEPNGMSLRPDCPTMEGLLRTFRGKHARVYTIPQGLLLPEELVLIHEHTDHYSLQTTKPIPLPDFNNLLMDFLSEMDQNTPQEILEMWEDVDDQNS
eukprot:m.240827 g.240827  ORF g.240827 m.240827 type:complete len:154 (-) comp16133_c0_seq1:203-664(-)